MDNYSELIEAAGGLSALAGQLSRITGQRITRQHVSGWRAREHIPPRYWLAIQEAALGWSPPRSLSLEQLARIEQERHDHA